MGDGKITGQIFSGVGTLASSINAASAGGKAEEYAQKGYDMQQKNLMGLQSLYGDAIKNTNEYIHNLTGETFASPAIQTLRIENQRNMMKREKEIQQAGLAGSGYDLQTGEQGRQQEAEAVANTTWQAEQQAQNMKIQDAARGMDLIQGAVATTTGQSNNLANMYEGRRKEFNTEAQDYYQQLGAFSAGENPYKEKENQSNQQKIAGGVKPFGK